MTVTCCKLKHSSVDYSFGLQNQSSVSATFLVHTNNKLDAGFKVVEDATRGIGVSGLDHYLPQKYDSFDLAQYGLLGDQDAGLFANQVKPVQNKQNPTKWEVTALWGPLPRGEQPGNLATNPLDRPVLYWYEFGTQSEEVSRAWNVEAITPLVGDARAANTLGPLVNTAMQDYDEALYEDRRITTLVMEKNFYTPAHAISLNNTYDLSLNSSAITVDGFTIPKHCARFDGATAGQPIFDKGVPAGSNAWEVAGRYFKVQVRIALSGEPFYRHLVNRGFNHFQKGPVFIGAIPAVVDRLIPATTGEYSNDGKSDTLHAANQRNYPYKVRDSYSSEPALLAANGSKLPDGHMGLTVPYRTRKDVDYSAFVNGTAWLG